MVGGLEREVDWAIAGWVNRKAGQISISTFWR